jgi:hypothetical protein
MIMTPAFLNNAYFFNKDKLSQLNEGVAEKPGAEGIA